MNYLGSKLEKIKQEGLNRSLSIHSDEVDFSSNDYLGISSSSEFNTLFIDKIQRIHKVGSTGSRLLTGNNKEIQDLENQISRFHDAQSTLVFSSGYQANLGLISAVADRGDTIIRDEYCHASILDAIRLSHANSVKFRHNDLTDLEIKIKKATGNIFVVIEGLYSMHGDMPNLKAMSEVCHKYQAHLIVDEAHTGGIYGSSGQGLVYENKIQDKVFARIMTYGKAFGYQGGAILGSVELTSYLINKSRPFMYTTAISHHQIAGLSVAYDRVRHADQERKQLKDNVSYFSKKSAFNREIWMSSHTQIQAAYVPGNAKVIEKAAMLKGAGFLAMAIRSPTVPVDQERIRICLHAYNTMDQIDLLIDNLTQ